MNSILINPLLKYPSPDDFFSPHLRYPEYNFDHISQHQNDVYDAVRQVFAQAGLDRLRFGTPEWNPLGEIIIPGSRVFVLCNFVYQRRSIESMRNFTGKCTHGSVLRAVLDYILLAVGMEGCVQFGNAPLQSCHWASVLSDTSANRVIEFYQARGLPVEACDLRLLVAERNWTGRVGDVARRTNAEGVTVDLGSDSLIAELDRADVHYRVLDYDPSQTETFHRPGRHAYVINRKILDSDVIFSIPKLKTHEKVGITCAIKGCVGAVGHKDSLAHHRFGAPTEGGDEYQADRYGARRAMSRLHDTIQKTPLDSTRGRWLRMFDRTLRRVMRPWTVDSGGAWWGNDTCWRMAVDLARVIAYADSAGKLQEAPIRSHIVLIDGIVGGEGNGPLSPTAVDSGVMIFGDSLVNVDMTAAILMGFEPRRLPIIWESTRLTKYRIMTCLPGDETIICNGVSTSFEQLRNVVSEKYRPPRGWHDHL